MHTKKEQPSAKNTFSKPFLIAHLPIHQESCDTGTSYREQPSQLRHSHCYPRAEHQNLQHISVFQTITPFLLLQKAGVFYPIIRSKICTPVALKQVPQDPCKRWSSHNPIPDKLSSSPYLLGVTGHSAQWWGTNPNLSPQGEGHLLFQQQRQKATF